MKKFWIQTDNVEETVEFFENFGLEFEKVPYGKSHAINIYEARSEEKLFQILPKME